MVVGYTLDPGIRSGFGINTQATAMITSYRGYCMKELWSKAVKSPAMQFLYVAFNPDATAIVTFAIT